MRRAIRLLLALALILFATGFTVLNSGSVPLDLYFYAIEAPISVLVFVCVALGALLGIIAASGAFIRRQAEVRRLKKRVSRLESEKRDLRRESEQPAGAEQGSLKQVG